MDRIEFSVAMSVYKNDCADYVRRALDSITQDQTVKPSEVVLVADGPLSDDLNEMLDQYEMQESTLRVIRQGKNTGLGLALKHAVEHCQYEWIARMDSDDISVPSRFEQQVSYICKNPDVDIVGGNIAEFIDLESNIVGVRQVPTTDRELKEYAKRRCPFNHMTVMFKKQAILDVGGYQHWHYNEDYYLWLRMILADKKFANLDANLVKVRVGKEMYQRRGGLMYFKSEAKLQGFMLKNKVIGFPRYVANVSLRLVLQVLMPNRVRGFIFQKFARRNYDA